MRRGARLALALLPSLALLAALPARAEEPGRETRRYHDAAGRLTGRAESRGGVTRYTDPAGRLTGRAETRR
jgi:YD repeat-containing protein